MLYNLKLSGALDRISGLIIGQFTEFNEDLSLGKPLYDALADILKEYKYPICFGFPVGHVTDNRPLICGAEVELTVNSKGAALSFIC
jgi:muramoyltetrapeptide carboxypeptidase